MAKKRPMSPPEFAKHLEALLEDVQRSAVLEYERAVGLETASMPDRPPEKFNSNHSFEHGSIGFGNSAGSANAVTPCYQHELSAASLHCRHHRSQVLQEDRYREQDDVERHWVHPPRLPATAQVSSFTGIFRRSASFLGEKRKKKLSLKEALRLDWNFNKSWWVLSPEQSYFWDCILLVAILFVAVVSPVQISMMDPKLDTMFWINCVIDLIFVIDMVLQFFTVYTVKTSFGHRLEHRHSRIVIHYLKTGFLVDFISVFPFDLVAVLMQSDQLQAAKGLKAIRILRLLKMARILKASKMIRRLEATGFVTYEGMALQKFIAVLLLVSHWLACSWAMTLTLEEGEGMPRWTDVLDDLEANVDLKTKDSIPKLYVASLYFTAYTITSVGYGDITPKNIIERVVCTLMLFVSGVAWACVIGQVSSIVGNMDAQEQEFRRLMDNLNRMMRDRALPRSVCRRLRKFFIAAKQAQVNEQQQQIVHRLSPDLQGEVVLMSNWYWVSHISLIKHIMPEEKLDNLKDLSHAPHFLTDITLSLRSAVFAQSEVFGAARVLYILRRGLVMTRVHGWMKVACTGSVWGEDFLLSDPRLRDPEIRLALTYVEVFFLELRTFMMVVERHRLDTPELEQKIRRFTVQLSARRAIIAEARWRRYKAQLESEDAEIASSKGCPAEPSRWRNYKDKKKCLLDTGERIPDNVQIAKSLSSLSREMETFKRLSTPSCPLEFKRLATPPDPMPHREMHQQPHKSIRFVANLP